jgi:hypothetical protein
MTNIKKKKGSLGTSYVGNPASLYHVYANDAETNKVHDYSGVATLSSLEANLLYQTWNCHGKK